MRLESLVAGLSLLASALLLTACAQADNPPAHGAAAASSIEAGVYETLMLAVGSEGRVTGYYREAQGEGVTKTCEFFLEGNSTTPVLTVKTWNDQTFAGELSPGDDAVTLKAPRADEHPGCGLVLLPEIATDGVELSRTLARPWIELRTIAAVKSRFHSAPSPEKKAKAYLVQGDVVGVLASRDGWLQIEYAREGKITAGWIPAGDTAVLHPPCHRIPDERPT